MFDNTINLLGKSLDLRAARHDIIANNIANIDTPAYKAVDVKFEEELGRAIGRGNLPLDTTKANHIPSSNNAIESIKPKLVYENNPTMRNDLNDVNIEQEIAKLTENTLQYSTNIQSMALKFKMLGDSIRGK